MYVHALGALVVHSAVGSLCSRTAPVPARTESGGKRTLDARVGRIGIIAVFGPLALCAVCSMKYLEFIEYVA